MALSSLVRTFSLSSSHYSRRPPSAAGPHFHRRAPVVGALWVLSLGTITTLAFKTGCSYSLPFLRSKANQSAARSLHSAAMESASTIVPAIVVYVTVPNKEADLLVFLVEETNNMDSTMKRDSWTIFAVKKQGITIGMKLAESIIKEKLAACVNRVPGVESVYWWDGKVQTDAEELLIIKTRESLLDALTEHVKSNHEYDVPEVIALPINGGNLKYLEWIKNSTREN